LGERVNSVTALNVEGVSRWSTAGGELAQVLLVDAALGLLVEDVVEVAVACVPNE